MFYRPDAPSNQQCQHAEQRKRNGTWKHPKLCILSPGLEIHWCDQGEATGWNAARSSLCRRCSSHCVDTSRADCTALRPLPSSPATQCEAEAVPHTPCCQWNSQLKHTKWKSAQRDASTALAVVRQSQKFSPHCRTPSRGRGTANI